MRGERDPDGELYFYSGLSSFDHGSSYYYYGDSDRRPRASSSSTTAAARVMEGLAEVVLVQEFRTPNAYDDELNADEDDGAIAFYRLLLSEGSVATAFSAESEARGTIAGVVESRAYVEAALEKRCPTRRRPTDECVILGTEDSRRTSPETLVVGLGRLPPKDDVRVTVTYLTRDAALKGGTSRFVLPVPYKNVDNGNNSNDWTMSVNVTMGDKIDEIVSDTHVLEVTYNGNDGTRATVEITRTKTSNNDNGNDNDNENDVVMTVTTIPDHQPKVYVDYSNASDSTAVTLSVIPDFVTTTINDKKNDHVRELVFLVDRAPSMKIKMERIRTALAHVLENVVPRNDDCLVNVLAFNASVAPLFEDGPTSLADDGALDQALRYANAMESSPASLPKTHVGEALRRALDADHGDRDRVVFVVTDRFHNMYGTTRYAETRRDRGRVFVLGVGKYVDADLARGLARAGRGTTELVLAADAPVGPALERQIESALSTSLLWGARAEWVGLDDDDAARQTPLRPPPLSRGDDYEVRLLVPGRTAATETLQAVRLYADETLVYEVPRSDFVIVERETDSPSHAAVARSLIRDLEEETTGEEGSSSRNADAAVVDLGTTYGVASSETVFVTVDEDNRVHVLGFDDEHVPSDDDDVVTPVDEDETDGSGVSPDDDDDVNLDCYRAWPSLTIVAYTFLKTVYQTCVSWSLFRWFS